MRTFLLLLLAVGAARPLAAQPAADVPVQRVILFTSGVGYFEHGGAVVGDADLALTFEEAALNDVLKSLLVEDRGGRVAGVVYPSQAPLERTLQSFALDFSDTPDLPGLLLQARGAEVIVSGPGVSERGTIVTVGSRPGATFDLLTLRTTAGLAQISFEDIARVAFTDPAMQAELDGALAALAEATGNHRRTVRVQFRGDRTRPVRVGYVVESPVWKTSYRLILGDDDAGTLQGWALVENPTETDWQDVDLTLVSGRPVSFVQDLYTPRYIQRPRVTPADDAVVRPRAYAEGAQQEMLTGSAPARYGDVQSGVTVTAERTPLVQSDAIGAARVVSGGRATEPYPPPPPPAVDPTVGVQARGTAGDYGEMFAYRLGDVTLPRRGSAMLPIVQEGVGAERLSIYSGGAGRHPMRAVRLRNTTGAALRAGPATVLDDGYAGDAILPDLPPGTDRIVSYAVDQDVLVDYVALPDEPHRITTATLRTGVLTYRAEAFAVQAYRIHNRGDRARRVMVEVPRLPGSRLDAPAGTELTPTHVRPVLEVAAGVVDTLVVRQARTVEERLVMADQTPERLQWLARADGALPAGLREALEAAVAARRALSETQIEIERLEVERDQIDADQTRVRENLRTVDQRSDYGRRLLERLATQEDRIEAIDRELDGLRAHAVEQRGRLDVTLP